MPFEGIEEIRHGPEKIGYRLAYRLNRRVRARSTHAKPGIVAL
jgi:hypothetical protein